MLNLARPDLPGRDDLPALFAGLDAAPMLLAVSGGPDSMALLHLAASWRAQAGGGHPLHVATVDHGLRPEAAAEAAMVAAASAVYGLPHATLVWEGDKPATGLQARAREARYRLLGAHARALGAPFVLTAHHADDQTETVLMRLGRGSGVAGLAAMRRVTPLVDGVALVRPLLGLTKLELEAVCREAGLATAADPSNRDPAFLRVRLRAQAAAAAGLGLDRPALLRLARRMARADEALEAETDRVEALLQPHRETGAWRANLTSARHVAPEIVQRLVARAVAAVAAPDHLALEKLETFTDALAAALHAGRALRRTLGGALLALEADGTLLVTPEQPRRRGRPRRD